MKLALPHPVSGGRDPMSLDTIDQLLTDWRKKLDVISQNLIELQDLPTYQRLAGEAGFPPPNLLGQTRSCVDPALSAMTGLFEHFELLAATLNQAQGLRQQISGKRALDEKIAEIVQLLTGESIQLPLVAVPLAQRDLLSGSHDADRVKPMDLMLAMVKSFETARDVVLAVDRAWANLEPKLTASFQQIQAIQTQAGTMGLASFEQLVQAEQAIALLHDRVDRDPLGVQDEFETTIAPLIQTAQASLQQVQQQQQQIHSGIAQAGKQIQHLHQLHEQALALYQDAAAKIRGEPLQVPLAPETLAALAEWQQTLASKLAAGMVQPLVVGLQNWQVKYAAAKLVTDRSIASTTQALNRRDELRGRLHALQAKAQARGQIEDVELVKLAAQIHQTLFSRPSDLAQASQDLVQYDRRLNGLVRAL